MITDFLRGKKLTMVLMACTCAALIVLERSGLTQQHAPADDRVSQEPRIITAAIPRNWPPHYQVDADGKPGGFAVESMEEIARLANVRVQYRVYESFLKANNALRNKEVDIVPNVGIVPSRGNYALFTPPVETFVVGLFVRAGTLAMTEREQPWQELAKNKRIGVVINNLGEILLDKESDVSLARYQSVHEALVDLMAGRIDAIAYPAPIVQRIAHLLGLSNRIEMVGTPMREVRRGVAIRNNDPKLRHQLSAAVDQFVRSDTYREIFKKWFGAPEPFWNTRTLILYIGAPVAALFILLVIWRYYSVTTLNRRLMESRRVLSQLNTDLEQRVIDRTSALEREKRLAETYLDMAGAMIVATDQQGHVLRLNRRGTEILGWREEELKGKSWLHQCVAEHHRRLVIDKVGKVLAGSRDTVDQVENEVVTKDGRLLLTTWNNTALRDPLTGEMVGMLSAGEDITERRAAEKELLAIKKRLEDVLESMTDGVVLFDKDQRFVLCNKNYRETHQMVADKMRPGVPAEQLARAMLEHGVWTVPSGSAERVLQGRLADMRTASGSFEMTVSSGQTFLVKDHRTQEGGTLVTRTDITERKRTEQHLFHAQKMEALGALAGGVAHSLNNLLTPIMALNEVVMDELPADNDARRSMAKIAQATGKARELVSGILAFSRQERSQMERLDLFHLVHDAVDLVREAIPKTTVLMEKLSQNMGSAVVDRSQIETMILNMINNAVHAIGDAPDGRIVVALEPVSITDECKGKASVLAPGLYARLTITDNGCGMDPETQLRIFDPFFTTKQVGKGTGLGLSMAHGIAEKHGGTIAVDSIPGNGTTFSVFLPLEPRIEHGAHFSH